MKIGDEITVRPRSQKSQYFENIQDVLKESTQAPLSWQKFDSKKLHITVTGLPKREEAEPEINEQLIVEYYSR